MSVGFNSNYPVGGVAGVFNDVPARSPASVDRSAPSETPQGGGIRRSEQAVDMLERDAGRRQSTQSRLAGGRANNGIAAYQDVASQPQRAEIQSMLGIDLFA
ncbi:MAG: hypothetical protein LAT66_07800 [Alkalimonas sp.]|nr:hypothetical protein [Alkalimonas sp.]